MSSEELALRRYARAIERFWSEIAERPIVFSPRDFALLADWASRAVPLELVREALCEARDRRRDGAAPRRLSAIAPLVEETWRTVLEGRVDTRPTPTNADGPVAAWRRRASAPATPEAVRRRLDSLLERLDAGADPAAIDDDLERSLPELLTPAVDLELRTVVDERLAPHRDRLAASAFAAARRRALSAARRRALGVPRLLESREPDPG